MSLEQLIFIVIFLLFPLVRTIAERRNKRRQEERAQELFETATAEPPASSFPPDWPAPVFQDAPLPVPAPPPRPAPPSGPVAAPRPRAEEVEPERPLRQAASLRSARARARAGVPRTQAELRRALLLVEILGPPRALERHER